MGSQGCRISNVRFDVYLPGWKRATLRKYLAHNRYDLQYVFAKFAFITVEKPLRSGKRITTMGLKHDMYLQALIYLQNFLIFLL